MKKILAMFLILGFIACTNLEVKDDDVFVATSVLISADYVASGGGFGNVGEHYWVLKFENGMVIQLDLNFQNNKPKSFQVGKAYDIYKSPDEFFFKVRLAREDIP